MQANNSSTAKQRFVERRKRKRGKLRKIFKIGSIFQWTVGIFLQ